MSTSLYFCASTPANRRALRRWAEVCGAAVFNGTGPHPGHGDQGILNAVLFAEGRTPDVPLLDNFLWSQHWTYWDSLIDWRDGTFVNRSAGNQPQRSFHCGGAEKFWMKLHSDRVRASDASRAWPYVWFLAMFWFGHRGNRPANPADCLSPSDAHLAADVEYFLPFIQHVRPAARY